MFERFIEPVETFKTLKKRALRLAIAKPSAYNDAKFNHFWINILLVNDTVLFGRVDLLRTGRVSFCWVSAERFFRFILYVRIDLGRVRLHGDASAGAALRSDVSWRWSFRSLFDGDYGLHANRYTYHYDQVWLRCWFGLSNHVIPSDGFRWGGRGVHRSPLWTPRSWARAPTVSHGPKAREAGGTGGARVHERRAEPTVSSYGPSSPEFSLSQAYIHGLV